jgi:phosphonopyruvate decarboxylase
VVLNNASHESVGGMPTIAKAVDLTAVAKAAGYVAVYRIEEQHQLLEVLTRLEVPQEGPVFVEVVVASGSRGDLIRPDTTPVENKDAFMSGLAGDAT